MKNPHQNFSEYFKKRALRIYIPLILVMILGYLVRSYQNGNLLDPNLRDLMLNLFMLQDISSLKPNVVVNPYMGNSPLWSLSYEWWFYMLYYPLVKIKNPIRNHFVFIIATIASVVYLLSPTFLPRLLMYLSIWWAGVFLSNAYIQNRIDIYEVSFPVMYLSVITLICGYSVYRSVDTGSFSSIGVHPALEFRHHFFATAVIILAYLWKLKGWVGYRIIFKPFLPLASFSYGIYISHAYFIHSSFLSFLKNKILENISYFLLMLLFSYLLEIKIYPYLRKNILNITRRSGLAEACQ